MQMVSPDLIADLCGLSLGLLLAGVVIGFVLWLFGWQSHRFWVVLLTTVAVQTAEEARERVGWYACRWGIEVWHRILKSGCRIEARPLATGERLQRCLTLYSVIAWRVFYAIMWARAVPEMSCDVWLEIEEWQALYCAIHHCPIPPDSPPSLGAAVRWIGSYGDAYSYWFVRYAVAVQKIFAAELSFGQALKFGFHQRF